MAVDVHWERREEVKVHPEIVSAVRLHWDLMVMESKRFGGNGVDVNREGCVYTRCLAGRLWLVWHFGLCLPAVYLCMSTTRVCILVRL